MKKLLGAIRPMESLRKNDLVLPDKSELSKPLEWTEAVCRSWCKQCGVMTEINASHALKLQEISGKKISGDIIKVYFIVSYCLYCKEQELTIEIKNI
jgi:hypothetical protein